MKTLKPVWLLLISLLFSQYLFSANISSGDSLALVSLYNSTNGNNWVKNDNWLTGPVKTWYGLVFEKDSLKAINLSGNNLKGTLPVDLYNLRTLKYIYISFNELSGPISNNIGNLSNLVVLWAAYNNFSGSLPTSIGDIDSLRTLYLNNNMFEGSIPASFGNLTKLENMNLSFNNLSGSVPSQITTLNHLKYIYLNDNKLSGNLPDNFGTMVQLKALRLENNFISGIPDLTMLIQLKNIPGEKNFAIFNNYLDFVDLLKNRRMFTNEANYFPQRTFPLSITKYVHPGDSVYLNLPSISFIDTASKANKYRYYLDGKIIREWSSKPDYVIPTSVYSNVGTYVCYVSHDSFPDKTISISNVRVLPPTGYSWISLATLYGGKVTDTIDYSIIALKKSAEAYEPVAFSDTLLFKRKEFLIPYGTYLIKLKPTGNDTMLFERYFRNTFTWTNQPVSFANRGKYSYNVTMIEKIATSGTGSISGNVLAKEMASTDSGEPIIAPIPVNGMDVYLFSNTLNKMVAVTKTNASGYYSFGLLSFGTYTVYTDYIGYKQDSIIQQIISADKPSLDNINFSVFLHDRIVLKIRPINNPTAELFSIEPYGQGEILIKPIHPLQKHYYARVFDLSGREAVPQTSLSDTPTNIRVNAKGIYIVRIEGEGNAIAKKIFIR